MAHPFVSFVSFASFVSLVSGRSVLYFACFGRLTRLVSFRCLGLSSECVASLVHLGLFALFRALRSVPAFLVGTDERHARLNRMSSSKTKSEAGSRRERRISE